MSYSASYSGGCRNFPGLRGLDRGIFVGRLAYYLGEVNALHPFREGNGRAQREFVRQFGQRNGLVLDWKRISCEEMI